MLEQEMQGATAFPFEGERADRTVDGDQADKPQNAHQKDGLLRIKISENTWG